MEIRSYRSTDADMAVKLWNDCFESDSIDAYNFYKRIVYDVNFDAEKFLFAVEGDKPCGFVYGTTRRVHDEIAGLDKGHGWIVAMGVSPCCRRSGIGRMLLAEIERRLKDEGVTKIDIGTYATNYFCPGVDIEGYPEGVEFFINAGYEKRGECVSMDMELHKYEYPEKYKKKKQQLIEQGYDFKLYEPGDALSLFAFMREDFPYWLPNVRELIVSGYAERRLVVAKNAEGKTVGFVMRSMDGTEERFGPFGTSPALQGIGLGSVLFNEMMQHMVNQRVFYTYFLWTGGRNLDIYATWGMKIYRTYAIMTKNS